MITIKIVFASLEISITLFLSSESSLLEVFIFKKGQKTTLLKCNSYLRNNLTVSTGVYYSLRIGI